MVLPLLLIGAGTTAAYYWGAEEVEELASDTAKVILTSVEWGITTILNALGEFWQRNKISNKIYGLFFSIIKGITKPQLSAYIFAALLTLFSFWAVKSKIKMIEN